MCMIQSQRVENILPSQEKPVVIFIQKHSRQVQISIETTENRGTICGQQICRKGREREKVIRNYDWHDNEHHISTEKWQ